MELRRWWLLPATAFIVAGCAEQDGPLAPADTGSGLSPQAELECQVNVQSGALSCSAPGSLAGGASAALIGGQDLHVVLESSNVSYDAATSVFSADVSVRNLLDQTLGTTDGVNPDAEGVRIFFSDAPRVTDGSGAVSVSNSDGVADFDKTSQDYFQYSQSIAPGGRSLPRTWEWDVPSTVVAFSFTVGVSAKLANETSINPGLRFVPQRIAADTFHTCVLDLGGQAYCWGAGGSGRLGNGSTDAEEFPAPVLGGIKFATIATGHAHTCGISDEGVGYCWGSNGNGRLGHGQSGAKDEPELIAGDYRWTHITASSSNTCGVTVEGEGYCWGYASGRLGDGIGAQANTPSRVLDPPSGPVQWKMINSSHLHTCGLTTDGVVYCWGSGGLGRHGAGDPAPGTTNAPGDPITSDERFVHLTSRERHNCAVTAAGDGYCWGLNTSGQLGIGASGDTVAIPTLVAGGHKFSEIHAGWDFSCGLTFSGDAYCWGTAENGRLGNGEDSGISDVPVLVGGGHKFNYLSTGITHACGVTIGGEIYCWGTGMNGQLGNGTLADQAAPVLVSGLSNIAWLNTLPAAGCADGGLNASCFPARSSLESYAASNLDLSPQPIGFGLRRVGPLAGA